MMPILQVGPLAIQLPGLILILGLWIGITLSERYAPLYDLDPNKLYNLVLVALIGGVLGARLGYVARYPSAFVQSPISLISLNPGLLDLSTGFLVAMIAGIIYMQRAKMPFWSCLDSLVPLLATLMVASAGANLASGYGFGSPADLPWSLQLFGERRHPTQIYEIVLGGMILFILLPGTGPIARYIQRYNRPGLQALAFVILFTTSTIFSQGFHGDSILILGGFRRTQLIAWLLLAGGLAVFANLAFRSSQEDVEIPTA